jgi:hypothetical protein
METTSTTPTAPTTLSTQITSIIQTTCEGAAWMGNLRLLKELRGKGVWWDRSVTAAAASIGHLEMLKWAYENGCPIDKYASIYAANCGHLHILQWLKETNNLVDDYLFGWATNYEHLNVSLWCIEQKLLVRPSFFYLQASCKTIFAKFVPVKKLLDYSNKHFVDLFYDQDAMARWVDSTDNVCDEICYKDLSNLIKIFV